LRDSGSIAFSDLDLSDRHTTTATYINATASSGASVSTALGTALQDLANTFTLSGSGVGNLSSANSGTVNWAFSLDNSLSQYLAAGDSITATYRITVSDDNNITTASGNNAISRASQDVTITINGANDGPSLSTTLASGSGSDTTTTYISSDFSTTPTAATIGGSAFLSNGELVLTPATGSQNGYFVYDSLAIDPTAFSAQFDYRSWDGSGADGTSFNYGPISTAPGGYPYYEYGITPTGLTIALLEYGTDRIAVKFNDTTLQTTNVTLEGPSYRTFAIAVDATNRLSVFINDQPVISNVDLGSSYATADKSLWKFGFGSRTGGSTNRHSIDNVRITDRYLGSGVTTSLVESNASLSAGNALSVSDVDLSNTVTATKLSVARAGTTSGISGLSDAALLAMFSLTPAAPSPVVSNTQTTGTLNWAFDSGSQTFDYLAAGEQLTLTYTARVTDSSGATAEQPVTVTISGSNDPVQSSGTLLITAPNELGSSVVAGSGQAGVTAAGSSGSLLVNTSDLDSSNVLRITTVQLSTSGAGTTTPTTLSSNLSQSNSISGLYGTLTLAPNGSYSYAINDSLAAVNTLREDQWLDETFTLTVSDGQGSSTSQAVTLRIDGSNDGPVSSGAIVNAAPIYGTYEISDSWKRLIVDQNHYPSIPGRNASEFQNEGAFAALRADGSVVSWGNAYYGGSMSAAVASALATDVAQVFSSSLAFAAVRDDGSVVSWGAPEYGGDNSAVADALKGGVSSVASTTGAFAALRADGSVVTWGGSGYGGDSSAVAGQINGSGGIKVNKLFSSTAAFAALRSDGSVITWGDAAKGGLIPAGATATALNGTVDVVSIRSSNAAFAALRADGSVVTWG
ncbi:MAG: hypothetical protein EBZ51_10820, partial [Synechococcaceae bacterium WB9_2_112]|nr:hypothetical protein [Synechococcaceae bacterium WB9_2_112]